MRPCEAKAQLILPLEGAADPMGAGGRIANLRGAGTGGSQAAGSGGNGGTNAPNPFPVEVVDVHRVDVVLRLVVLPFMFPILMLQFLMTGHNRAGKRGNVRKRQLSNLIVQSAQRSTTLVSVLNSVVLS